MRTWQSSAAQFRQAVRSRLIGESRFSESGPVGKEGQDEEVVKGTQERYFEAVDLLTRR